MKISRDLLVRVRNALVQAIVNEDGLDGGVGAALLDEISVVLGINEWTPIISQTQPNNGLQPTPKSGAAET